MAQIECGRGHLYDPDKYPTCPYCNGNQKITVTAARRTAPLNPFRAAHVTGENKSAPVSVNPCSLQYAGILTSSRYREAASLI